MIHKTLLPILTFTLSNTSAQSLYDRPLSDNTNASPPLTWTGGINLGYSSSVSQTFANRDPEAAAAWLASQPLDPVPTSPRDRGERSDRERQSRDDSLTEPQAFGETNTPPDEEPGTGDFIIPLPVPFPFPVPDQDAETLNLITDATLALDDHFGFENQGLTVGKTDFRVSSFYNENKSAPQRRNTTGIRADLDFAINNNIIIGSEIFYSEGDSAHSHFDATGLGLDASYHQTHGKLDWEIGLGAGTIWGDFKRNFGNHAIESDQNAQIFTAHAALRNSHWNLFGLQAFWEIGLKQRFVRQNSATESGITVFDLKYPAKSLHTTLANLELGLQLNPKLSLELALNPVISHEGGNLEASQTNGSSSFSTPDFTGYDTHTARLSLFFIPTESSTISASLLAGSENTWSSNLAFRLRF